jgi:hypothetical protein
MATLLLASSFLGGAHGTPVVSAGEKPFVTAFAQKGKRLDNLAIYRFLNFEKEFIFIINTVKF